MAKNAPKPPRTPPAPPPAPAPEATQLEENLPEVEMIGLSRVAKGWVLLGAVTQGMKILSTEVICGPDLKAIVLERMRVEVARRFMVGTRPRISA